eukprot:INCI14543.2.p1 GENE.INCI14543.2~~INCI14543.2.p1  ORF type:complete len:442 (+),score=64.12 INCI14543.2:68-1327(+)
MDPGEKTAESARSKQPALGFEPKTVLLTGGAGFIGSHVACLLARSGVELVVVDKLDYCASLENLRDVSALPNVAFVKQDITDVGAVKKLFESYPLIDTVMHFAAQTHVDNSFGNSFTFTHNNVMGTHVMLEAAKLHGKVKRFIHVSTDEVYGDGASGLASTEASSFAPTNPYAATKCAAECLVQAYGRSFGLPTIITRSNNIYGPKQYPEKLIPKFISLLLKRREARAKGVGTADLPRLPIHGNGLNARNYLFAADVAAAFNMILRHGTVGQVYNIGTSLVKRNIDVAEDLVRAFEFPSESASTSTKSATTTSPAMAAGSRALDVACYIKYVSDRPFNDLRYTLDSSKLEKLGWSPSTSWEDGLRRTIDWYTANPTYYGDISKCLVAHPRAGLVETSNAGSLSSTLTTDKPTASDATRV